MSAKSGPAEAQPSRRTLRLRFGFILGLEVLVCVAVAVMGGTVVGGVLTAGMVGAGAAAAVLVSTGVTFIGALAVAVAFASPAGLAVAIAFGAATGIYALQALWRALSRTH